jgi:CBS domain-containing protein
MAATTIGTDQRLILEADTAGDLMTANPISIQGNASIRAAIAFLVDNGFSAAPVIDGAGKPLGVLSQTDLLIHQREAAPRLSGSADFYKQDDIAADSMSLLTDGVEARDLDETCVRDIMTPIVLAVSPRMSASKVIEQLLIQRVHRLFVVDDSGVLIGVVSTVDVLKHLHPEGEASKQVKPHSHKGAL